MKQGNHLNLAGRYSKV